MQNPSMTKPWKTVLNVSNNGRRTRTAHAKSNSITTMRRIRSDSANVIRTEIQALSEDCCIMEIRTSPLPSPWNVSTDGAYIPDIYATVCIGEPHAIWGSLFLCRRHDDSILISCCKNSCLPRNSRKAALPGWLSGKKSSSLRSGIFFRQALQGCGQTDNRDNKK